MIDMENANSLDETFEKIEKKIGYRFRNRNLLREALTHSSYANENDEFAYNEKLEFLGDAVLELTVSEHLYKEYENLNEGRLTRMRAQVVCERKLYEWALHIGLAESLRLGRSLLKIGPTVSVLADASESLFGAVFLDGGYVSAASLCANYVDFHKSALSPYKLDPKTRLQEMMQGLGKEVPHYRKVAQTGPDHSPTFKVEVFLNDEVLAEAWGRSVKEAEFKAAAVVLKKYAKSAFCLEDPD
jgi:ribonuclease-3